MRDEWLWWARQDLNLGPTDYESAALTAELQARSALTLGFYNDLTQLGEPFETGDFGHRIGSRFDPLSFGYGGTAGLLLPAGILANIIPCCRK